MYEWILWRHAEAGFARSDLERPLTGIGQQQAEDSALWLKTQGVNFPVYCSEAVRGQQTAAYYGQAKIIAGLNPGSGMRDIRDALNVMEGRSAVIVGHLPWINYITEELLGEPVPTYNYSSLCWLQNRQGSWALNTRYRF